MTDIAIRFLLPLATGYLVFILTSRSLNAWRKPENPNRQNRWSLGSNLGAIVATLAALSILVVSPTQTTFLSEFAPVLTVFAGLALTLCIRAISGRKTQSSIAKHDFDSLEFEMTEAMNGQVTDSFSIAPLDQARYNEAFDDAYNTCTTSNIDNVHDGISDSAEQNSLEQAEAIFEANAESSENDLADQQEESIQYEMEETLLFDSTLELTDVEIDTADSTIESPRVTDFISTDSSPGWENTEYNQAFDQAFDACSAQQTVAADTTGNEQPTETANNFETEQLDLESYDNAFEAAFTACTNQLNATAHSPGAEVAVINEENTADTLSSKENLDEQRNEFITQSGELLRQQIHLRQEAQKNLETARQALATVESEYASASSSHTETITKLQNELQTQTDKKLEIEKNLRITRRALANAGVESSQSLSAQADKLSRLEEQLQQQIQMTAKAENKLLRETEARAVIEHKLATAKDSMLQARTEVRRNIDARTKALLTARKAVNFARRSVEARERVQRKMDDMRTEIDLQNNTTSNLLRSLEREKQKNIELRRQLESMSDVDLEGKGFRILQSPRRMRNSQVAGTQARKSIKTSKES